ncbi:hypothetical protein CCYS_12490 [Corynebacterium cystitidis DSM 20524]|uniref:Uncharacterized protein n=1 Tax=Corynebacterium cystitidis DSM 20524 TaxID=1121357 RepID=A0A1H9V245_9CORY|nr:hypothetical protein CCYS_12490 [Corynebacterium cystitidis DSM 20524]SES15796.1 hypothetical protein SAMN05661109_02028 [Corynebacterium cystitidis DSM 20524]SNV62370.1 Uncharacterised protein [Corynebacterium cystitidis]
MGIDDSAHQDLSYLRSARLLGWGAMAVAFVSSYLFWIIGRQWWWPSVVITSLVLVAICVLNCYLAHKARKYDLYIAAFLTVLSPVIIITIAFGFFFSGPPS